MERELRINEQIRRSPVRVIDEDGAQLGVMSTQEALQAAREVEMDLVEVDPNSSPPVCRIMDYGKYKYRQKKRLHQSTQKQHAAQIKGVRLFPRTDEHDLEHKARHAAQFLQEGDKVLVFMRFFGRWFAHIDVGQGVMNKFAALVGDVARVEQPPHMEGRRMSMMLAPMPASQRKAAKKQQTQPPQGEPPSAQNENP